MLSLSVVLQLLLGCFVVVLRLCGTAGSKLNVHGQLENAGGAKEEQLLKETVFREAVCDHGLGGCVNHPPRSAQQPVLTEGEDGESLRLVVAEAFGASAQLEKIHAVGVGIDGADLKVSALIVEQLLQRSGFVAACEHKREEQLRKALCDQVPNLGATNCGQCFSMRSAV